MPVYNGAKYLADAIDSALAQTYRTMELIIVNDCSNDESEQIILSYQDNPCIRYLRSDSNGGTAASRNLALKHARGGYIAFLDQDDIWLPNKLALQMEALKNNPTVGLLHARYARIDTHGQLLPQYRELGPEHFGNAISVVTTRDVFEEIFISNDIQPLTTIIPRAVLDEVGWFNPELPGVDDYELWLRIAYRYPVANLDTILGFWRQHESQQSNQGYRMLLTKLKAINTFIEAHPEAPRRVAKRAYVERMYSMNRTAGNHHLYDLRDYQAASKYFATALDFRPLDLGCMIKLAYCRLPESVRSTIRNAKNSALLRSK